MVRLTIDGQEVFAVENSTILQAAKSVGVRIPTLCFHDKLKPIGACRLCVVEVDGSHEAVTACDTQVKEGISVRTQTEALMKLRRDALKLILANHPLDCPICAKAGECMLQDLVYELGVTEVDYRFPSAEGRTAPYASPMIHYWHSRCILCLRCVSACRELTGACAIHVKKEGAWPIIQVDPDVCVSCGQCVQVCPVGALVENKHLERWRPWDVEKIRTTCPYCGVGCQQLLHVKDSRILSVTGVEEGAPNQGRLCVKGRFGYDFIYSKERLKTPMIRENGLFREASWDEALDLVASRFKQIIQESGPDALGGVSCARSINEDSYNMQKLFRAVFKTNNIDHCARVCHAPTVAGLAASFGEGAMTNSLAEFSKAKMIMVIGSNMTEAHPVAATFIKDAVTQGAELIVVDPRRHRLADYAHTFIQLKVGSDIALINALMCVLIEEDLYDKAFVAASCTGFDELKEKVMGYPPERSAGICGINPETIRKLARRIASVKPMMVCYTLGITEHTCGKNNVMDIANMQMLLGNIGIACGGVNPLRGQNNVQGACDMGALPNVFPGYQKVTDKTILRKFEAAWGVEHLSDKVGLMIPQMMEKLVTREIRGFYIFGENLASTEADIKKVEHELASAEFLVCQDIFPTETTRFAHVVLPAAAWSENDGTFTNCERRVSRVRTASSPPGESKPNWWIFKQIAKRFGIHWASESAEEIWDNEVSMLAPNIFGIKYRRIEHDGIQWPCPTEEHPGTSILHKNGLFTMGLGKFNPVDWTPPAELTDEEYPLVLSTGRRLYHYHSRTQTGRCAGLNDLLGEERADISIEDAKAMGISDREMIRVASRRGEVMVRAHVTPEVPKGLVWMAFHFREGNANWLTNSASDPDTLTAEFKACAVKVSKMERHP